MEIHDYRRGSPYEEPPLQADPSAEHALRGAAPPPADRHSPAEQAARTLGPPELPPAVYIQKLLYF